jgi:hypothetical protein
VRSSSSSSGSDSGGSGSGSGSGSGVLSPDHPSTPSADAGQQRPAWLSQQAWGALCALDAAVPAFRGLAAAVASGGDGPPRALAAVLEGDDPFEAAGADELAALWTQPQSQQPPPDEQKPQPPASAPSSSSERRQWRLTPFQRLLLVRALREESLPAAFDAYVTAQLGPDFSPGSETAAGQRADDVSNALADSCAAAPIVLVVAQGADPAAALVRLAAGRGRALGRGLHMVSLGQGQGVVAESLVHLAMRNGDWVCLQVRAHLRC